MYLNVQSFVRPSTDQIIWRVPISSNGEQANKGTLMPQMSADRRYVLFESEATNLVPGDTNNARDIFHKDLVTGVVSRVSVGSKNEQGLSFSTDAHMSDDGRHVVFASWASNFVPNDGNNVYDVFHKDMLTGKITLVSAGIDGNAAHGSSSGAHISADGRYVVFSSDANDLVPGDVNNTTDIFCRDLHTGTISLVSTNSAGAQANKGSFAAKMSANGRYVIFASSASNLVPDDKNGKDDIFRKDLQTGKIIRVSTRSDGGEANSDNLYLDGHVSSDGRYVVFVSNATNLVPGDTNNVSDVFLKDLQTGMITLASTSSDGKQANSYSSSAQVSDDGRYVVFTSKANNLVSGDTNGEQDIFCKDMLTGVITRLSTAAAGQQGSSASDAPQMSPDGRYVTFMSNADNLVSGDGNGIADIFLVDRFYQEHAGAIIQSRFVETTLAVGNASQASIAWGDGTSSTVVPASGQARFSHAYASAGSKAATVSLVEGALTWSVAHTIDTSSGTMVRNAAIADTLTGSAGRDTLNGDGTADVLLGLGGNDRLMGSSGDDRLDGGIGNDLLKGDTGNDRLSGGMGKDTLYGGSGRDVFMFGDREAGSSKSKADYIADFSRRQGDKIDLSAIDASTKKKGNQKFAFIGDEDSFTKAGQVRFEKFKSTTYVYLNTDNDGAAEGVIKLKGSLDMQKSWFVL
jgi:Ca2+-binding RTX toxin-like protein